MPGEDTVRVPMFPDVVYPHWHGKSPVTFLPPVMVYPWEADPQASSALTEEEERLLVAFRRFKAMLTKPEGEFHWKTQQEPGVIPAPERFLIIDPQEDWNCR